MDISLIIPVYNVEEKYFRECLDSVLAQNMRKIEAIIADDGSTNGCGEIADEYAARHQCFKVLHLKNGGPGKARNIALSHATGKYLAFLDSDDVLVPGILDKMFHRAEHDKSDVTICNVVRFNSEKIWNSYNHRRVFRDLDSITDVRKSPELLYDTVSSNKLIRRNLWKRFELKYPEGILYEDIPVMTQVYLRANQVSVIRSTGYMWRVRDGETNSTTQRRLEFSNLQDRLASLRMLDKVFDEIVPDKALHFEKQIKVLKLDLKMYLNLCISQNHEEAELYAEAIREYIRESISDEAIASLIPIDQEIYRALMDDDLERLAKLSDFRKKRYKKAPCFENESKLYIKADKDLFDEENLDITESMKRRFPKVRLRTFETLEDGRFRLVGHLYLPMINIPDTNYQDVRAFLCDEYTGEETELKVEKRINRWTKGDKCIVTDEMTGESVSYDYKGTAFNVYLDPADIRRPQKESVILLRYENRFCQGTTLLRNPGKNTANRIKDVELSSNGITITLALGIKKVLIVNAVGNSLKYKVRGLFGR